MRVIKIYLGKKGLITHKTNKMGYGNKSVSGVHPILKHMNKLGGNPEIKYDPIAHDEKGMGRGGKLGTAKYKSEGMPKHGYHDKGMPKYGKKGEGMAMHNGYPHKKAKYAGEGKGGQDVNVDSRGVVALSAKR